MILTILQQYRDIKVLLVYSNRSKSNTIFYQQLKSLQKTYPETLRIEFLYSNQTDIHHKRLGIYLLEKILQQYVTGPVREQLFYLCGPFEYMRMITIVLRNHGVPLAHIRKEIFVIEKTEPKNLPPDRDIHGVTASIGNKMYSFETQFPETILQTAKKWVSLCHIVARPVSAEPVQPPVFPERFGCGKTMYCWMKKLRMEEY